MKKAQIVILTIFLLICIYPFTSMMLIKTNAQTVGNFRLDLINWTGTRTAGETVEVEFQFTNLNNNTITAIVGVLNVPFPFSDADDGDNNVTSIGESLITYFNVSQYLVLEGDLFQLTFSLDIVENASKGLYPAQLEINYFIKSSNGVSAGTPVVFPINLEIPNTPPEIDWVRPTAGTILVEPRELVNFSVLCSDLDNDSLEYSWVVDDIPVNVTKSSYLFISQDSVGIQEIIVLISDRNDTIARTWFVETQIPSITSISTNSQYIAAGGTSIFLVNISNNLWKGKVEIDLQIPAPLIVQSNSSLSFSNVSEGENVTIPITIFTPETAMGSTSAMYFTIQFSDKHGTNYAETISMGLIVYGRVRISVFSSDISSPLVSPGGNVVVSATLLNTGNTNALFVNASLESDQNVFIESTSRRSYLGELEPDSPLPFSLTGVINSSIVPGNYQIDCVIYYFDSLYNVHQLLVQFSISIENFPQEISSEAGLDMYSLFIGSGITVILGGGTAIAIIIVLFRRQSKK
ncbi:MAG: COG1361 S-layer family protein [Promethearchaeota archaeon]